MGDFSKSLIKWGIFRGIFSKPLVFLEYLCYKIIMSATDLTRRHPGGQPGNTNAIKHGFYSPRFREKQADTPQKPMSTDIRDEIEMLRESIRRIVNMSEYIESLDDALHFVRILALASTTLSRLVRTQQIMGTSDYKRAIAWAISDVSKELGDAKSSEELDELDISEELDEEESIEELEENDSSDEFGEDDLDEDLEADIPPEGLCAPRFPKFDPSKYNKEVKDG